MFKRIHRHMFPITLSKALTIVNRANQRGRRQPHWYSSPVRSLIQFLGDVAITEIQPDDIIAWYDWIREQPNERKPDQPLSAWTVDSYGRNLRAFFNHLVKIGHLDLSPARRLRLPRLPPKAKKEISQDHIELMVQHSEFNPRDHAIVLVLRDSGCRVGELVSMKLSDLRIDEGKDGKLRGRARIVDQKTVTSRFIYFNHEACKALEKYKRVRHAGAPDNFWLTHSGTPLSSSGAYQALKRVGQRAGVEHFNPHAFRHALAKRLVDNNTPHKIIQDILGHADITTTLNMYVTYDEDELADHHHRYTGYD